MLIHLKGGPKAAFKVYRGALTQHYHAKMCSNEFSYF